MRLFVIILISFGPMWAQPITSTKPPVDIPAQGTIASTQPVPEPTTWLMLTAGMLLMGMSILRQRKASGSK